MSCLSSTEKKIEKTDTQFRERLVYTKMIAAYVSG